MAVSFDDLDARLDGQDDEEEGLRPSWMAMARPDRQLVELTRGGRATEARGSSKLKDGEARPRQRSWSSFCSVRRWKYYG
ncbi:hypothetical protein CFAM422_003940 [Trichoderma lentiforme]|uniref:Uncharacterized protein n=1 Tax=Trichoderma lentiforme TaxID=1567552 RepID=A0A9P5CFD4_9HYPO|nr:hypothetical protein CFAM422_003940 [Trichoderma lentiforme]